MDIYEFLEAIKMKLQAYYGDEYTVSICSITKNNDHVKNGVTIRKNDENLAPTIYLDKQYEEYKDGRSFQDITDELITTRSGCADSIGMDMDFFLDYARVKDKLRVKLISKGRNKNLLQDIPHMDFADLSVAFYVAIEDEKIGSGSILIRNEHIKEWGVSIDRLYEDARNATIKEEPPYLADLVNMLTEIYINKTHTSWKDMSADIRQSLEEMRSNKSNMYVLTNSSKLYGATVIMYPGMLEEIGDHIEDDYYVIPSSLHEVLIVPQYACPDGAELSAMVEDVNRTELDATEILSEHAYRYHRDTHWLEPVMP